MIRSFENKISKPESLPETQEALDRADRFTVTARGAAYLEKQ